MASQTLCISSSHAVTSFLTSSTPHQSHAHFLPCAQSVSLPLLLSSPISESLTSVLVTRKGQPLSRAKFYLSIHITYNKDWYSFQRIIYFRKYQNFAHWVIHLETIKSAWDCTVSKSLKGAKQVFTCTSNQHEGLITVSTLTVAYSHGCTGEGSLFLWHYMTQVFQS
jgi:hypothetical protein